MTGQGKSLRAPDQTRIYTANVLIIITMRLSDQTDGRKDRYRQTNNRTITYPGTHVSTDYTPHAKHLIFTTTFAKFNFKPISRNTNVE